MDALFNNLYEKFFMRDLLARIAPGIFLLFVIWHVFPHRHLHCCENLNISILGVIFVLSISYFLGFGAQKLGEYIGILNSRFCFCKKRKEDRENRWRKQMERRVIIDSYPDKTTQSSEIILSWKKTIFCQEAISSESSTEAREMPVAVIRQRERLIYLKDGAGAFGMALMLSGVLFLCFNFILKNTHIFYSLRDFEWIYHYFRLQPLHIHTIINWILSIIIFLGGIFLILIHHTMWEEQAEYEIEVLFRMQLINEIEYEEHRSTLCNCCLYSHSNKKFENIDIE
jgi:hypothetical protein